MAKKNLISNVSYAPKSPIGKLYAKLVAAKGKPVLKENLYKGVGVHAPKLLAWILIHGRNGGLWAVKYSGKNNEYAALVLSKKGAANLKAAA